MRPFLRLWISAVGFISACSKAPPPPGPPPVPGTPVSRAIGFLLSRQEKDGRWRSGVETTRALETGQALTPFVLYAISHAPAQDLKRHREGIDRALDLLPIAGNEYPTYSLALSILALERLRARDVSSLKSRLKSMQLTEELGWNENDPEYGGWDEGVIPARKPQCQRPNLSLTALACEALGGDEKARKFAERCRAAGGGYLFTSSAMWAHQNKNGKRGYATATYDAHRILGTPLGVPPGQLPSWLLLPEDWGRSMAFYHAYVESKISPSGSIVKMLLALQRPDGSWANTSPLMKEDEPLVATGLALIALCLSR